jgi:hypothetical protein
MLESFFSIDCDPRYWLAPAVTAGCFKETTLGTGHQRCLVNVILAKESVSGRKAACAAGNRHRLDLASN